MDHVLPIDGDSQDSSSRGDRLVAELRCGAEPERVYRELFALYHRAVWRFFAHRGLSSEDCRDLTQETFVRVYTGMDGFRGDARFDTWLYQIALNTYRKTLRYGSADKRDGQEETLEAADGAVRQDVESAALADGAPPARPLDDLLAGERREALRRAIAGLPEQMRRCVLLRVYHELAYREIAAVLRVSIETVKAHLFQAKRKLRAELGGDFEVTW
ncbi:MAG TPA: sigma-70 family RNA polymerase sigma factor [Thermoanaerobaculia bacterium]|nr:sigma-70 family RNA polymerase sigma factor [Thermoanaerobaculia bacterium]